MYCADRKETPGNIGIPALGVTLKLVPQGGKLEARLKSPSIAPDDWRNPTLTEAAFDEEGFDCLGDAQRFAVPGQPEAGFLFDWRLAEIFKLATGTLVAVGALRTALVDALGGLASDAVIAGEERDDLRALQVPNLARLRDLAGQADAAIDLNAKAAAWVAGEIGGHAAVTDVADEAAGGALDQAIAALGPLRGLVNCAGIGGATQIVGRAGPMPLAAFERIIRVNLVGTFTMMRLAAARYAIERPRLPWRSEGIVRMALPAARALARAGVKVNTVVPDIFKTPLLAEMTTEVQEGLSAVVPFPHSLSDPTEFA